jgi:hypothetical protein
VVFDTSSLYGANIRKLTDGLPNDFLQQSSLIVPQEGRPIEESLGELHTPRASAILIDDLNALHYLLSSDKHRSGTRQLFTFLKLLSYEARITDLVVLCTLYRTEGEPAPKPTKRSLSAAADLQISTDNNPDRITFRCSDATSWPDNRFSAPLYF